MTLNLHSLKNGDNIFGECKKSIIFADKLIIWNQNNRFI